MNESAFKNQQVRGQRARELLNDELLVESFDILRSNLHKKFEQSKSDESTEREKIWQMLHLVNEVERHLKNIVSTGKVAEAELSRLQKLRQKLGV